VPDHARAPATEAGEQGVEAPIAARDPNSQRAGASANTATGAAVGDSGSKADDAAIADGERFLGWASAWLGSALLMGFACLLKLPGFSPRLGFAIAFALVAGEIVLTCVLAPSASRALAIANLFGSGFVLAGLWGAAPTAFSGALLTAALLSLASVLGAVIGARIERPGHLVAVVVVSSLADLWSVFDRHGPSAQLVSLALSQPERLALFALPWPLWGTGTIQPIIGVGDVAFVALYLAAYERHELALERALWALAAAFALGLTLLLVLERSVPLLPLLGAAVLLADRRTRLLAARELYTVCCVVALLLGALALRIWR
jgi:hypothetical protein